MQNYSKTEFNIRVLSSLRIKISDTERNTYTRTRDHTKKTEKSPTTHKIELIWFFSSQLKDENPRKGLGAVNSTIDCISFSNRSSVYLYLQKRIGDVREPIKRGTLLHIEVLFNCRCFVVDSHFYRPIKRLTKRPYFFLPPHALLIRTPQLNNIHKVGPYTLTFFFSLQN